MTSRPTWQEGIDAYGQVQPVLCATDAERRTELTAHVVLLDPADEILPGACLSD